MFLIAAALFFILCCGAVIIIGAISNFFGRTWSGPATIVVNGYPFLSNTPLAQIPAEYQAAFVAAREQMIQREEARQEAAYVQQVQQQQARQMAQISQAVRTPQWATRNGATGMSGGVPTFPIGSQHSATPTFHPSTGQQNGIRTYESQGFGRQHYGGSYTNGGTYYYDPNNVGIVVDP